MESLDGMLIEGIQLHRSGYTGTVCYDKEETMYFGKIIDIKDGVVYQGKTIHELQDCFNEAVDEYIELRKSVGK